MSLRNNNLRTVQAIKRNIRMEAVNFVSKYINFDRHKRLLLFLTILIVILNLMMSMK